MEESKLKFMSKFQKLFPIGYKLFLKIAEPRTVRLGFFGIYICMISIGVAAFTHPPRSFQNTALLWAQDIPLHLILSALLIVGGILSTVAVLPGIWWLERVGLFAMIFGMALFAIFTTSVYAGIAIALILVFALRWREIRRYQLAPLKIEPRKG